MIRVGFISFYFYSLCPGAACQPSQGKDVFQTCCRNAKELFVQISVWRLSLSRVTLSIKQTTVQFAGIICSPAPVLQGSASQLNVIRTGEKHMPHPPPRSIVQTQSGTRFTKKPPQQSSNLLEVSLRRGHKPLALDTIIQQSLPPPSNDLI